jgi:glycerol-3-phosphate acyltransferase PlsY
LGSLGLEAEVVRASRPRLNNVLETYFIVAIVAYLLGSIPFGFILVKLFLKQDIRQTGSGNIGATNVARSGARGLAIVTLVLDALKGLLAVGAFYLWFTWALVHDPLWTHATAALVGLCAVLGHMFPVWLRFRGGKGVATSIGAFLLLAPKSVALSLAVFVAVVLLTRYVSLGSVVAATIFPLGVVSLHQPRLSSQLLVFTSLTAALVIAKHHTNIRRLLKGTEHRFGAPKVPADPIQAEKNA